MQNFVYLCKSVCISFGKDILKGVFLRLINSLLVLITFPFEILSQEPKLRSTSWRDNWKMEVKLGTGALITPVPDKYLSRINNVNIPLRTPGPVAIFSFKKGITNHFEMGYQLDLFRIQGKVDVMDMPVRVLTKAITHTYLVQYNYKGTNDFKPLYNYFIYYKTGAISLQNNPLDKFSGQVDAGFPNFENKFISNVAVLTGMGGGINYQFTKNFSFTGSFELNRSSDSAGDVFQVQKLFYRSPNTVNRYMAFSGGISYWFNFTKPKKSSFFKARTETEKVLIQSKIIQHKGIKSKENKSDWYDHQRGK